MDSGARKVEASSTQQPGGGYPQEDEWMVSYLGSLLRQLMEAKYQVQEERTTRIQDLIDSLVR